MSATEFVILLGWGVLVLGFFKRDYAITAISSMYLMVIGTWILTSDPFTLPQMIKLGLGTLHIGIGFYILFRSGIETYKGKKFRKPKFKKRIKEEKMPEKTKEEETKEEETQGEEPKEKEEERVENA